MLVLFFIFFICFVFFIFYIIEVMKLGLPPKVGKTDTTESIVYKMKDEDVRIHKQFD